MKLLRYGPAGQEQPGILDAAGAIRDLSGVIPDITGDVLSPAALAKIAAVDVNSLPKVAGNPRLGSHIKRKAEIPFLVRAGQNGVLMHKARAIEQDIHRPGGLGSGGNGRIIQHIKRRCRDAWGRKAGQQSGVTVCGDNPRPFGGHGGGRCPANALAGRRHETKLTPQSACHAAFPRNKSARGFQGIALGRYPGA